jgi:hypothetical protein
MRGMCIRAGVGMILNSLGGKTEGVIIDSCTNVTFCNDWAGEGREGVIIDTCINVIFRNDQAREGVIIDTCTDVIFCNDWLEGFER